MSEAAPVPDRPHIPRVSYAQLRFKAGQELADYLQDFYRPAENEARPIANYFLFSNGAIRIDRISTNPMRGVESTIPAQVVGLQRDIVPHSRQLRPLAKRLQPVRVENKDMELHVDVILDELTAAAVRGLMLVQPDNSITAHHRVPRSQLVARDEFMAACHRLYERLLEASPLQITTTEVIESPTHR